MQLKLRHLLPLFLLALVMALSPRHPTRAVAAPQGTTFVVNTLSDLPDPAPGNGVCEVAGSSTSCTLRAAIMEANLWPGDDTITFSPSLPNPAIFTLTRVGQDDTALNGDLDITSNLTLIGRGASQTVVDGNGGVLQDRVLHVVSGMVTIQGITIQNGRATSGGGLYNSGVLTVMHSTLAVNHATFDGGGLYNSGMLTITHSAIRGNSSDLGGGVFVSGPTWLDQSTVHGNGGPFGGGGLYNQNALTITNSTVSSNHDGGIKNTTGAQLWAWNSTFDGNTSEVNGGGIENSGQVNLYNVTISHNVADYDNDGNGIGGGVYNELGAGFYTRNTLLVVNYRGVSLFPLLNDCSGLIWSDHSRFTSVPIGCGIVGPSSFTTDPNGIGPLADNGGPTLTVALLPGSDAIDAADSVQGCVNYNSVLPFDQRGAPRVAGTWCDVGAYEFGSLLPRLFLPLVIQ